MKKLTFIILLLSCLISCAIESDVKNVVNTYTIKKNANHSDTGDRIYGVLEPLVGNKLKFNFFFWKEVTSLKSKDSSVHKVYGKSDFNSHHLDNSLRIGFRVRQDSTIDVFALWHIKGKTGKHGATQWLGNVQHSTWHSAILTVTHHSYVFEVDGRKFEVRGRKKNWMFGGEYRLFPYIEFEDGSGASKDMKISVEEL